jgi:hypothetical protein
VDDTVYIFGGSAEYDETVQECKSYPTDLVALDVSSVARSVIVIPPPPTEVPSSTAVTETSTEATTKDQ